MYFPQLTHISQIPQFVEVTHFTQFVFFPQVAQITQKVLTFFLLLNILLLDYFVYTHYTICKTSTDYTTNTIVTTYTYYTNCVIKGEIIWKL